MSPDERIRGFLKFTTIPAILLLIAPPVESRTDAGPFSQSLDQPHLDESGNRQQGKHQEKISHELATEEVKCIAVAPQGELLSQAHGEGKAKPSSGKLEKGNRVQDKGDEPQLPHLLQANDGDMGTEKKGKKERQDDE